MLQYDAYQETPRARADEHDLCTLVQAEFEEMPGLKLTLAQASRLFDLEPARCAEVLFALIRSGRLVTDGKTFKISQR